MTYAIIAAVWITIAVAGVAVFHAFKSNEDHDQ